MRASNSTNKTKGIDKMKSILDHIADNENLLPTEFPADALLAIIDGDVIEVDNYYDSEYLPKVCDYYIAETRDQAGNAAKQYWLDLAEHDQNEFAYLIGESTLASWAIGHKAGPGTYKADSFEDWLDNAVYENPQEQFATYDGEETKIKINVLLAQALKFETVDQDENGFIEVFAYRNN